MLDDQRLIAAGSAPGFRARHSAAARERAATPSKSRSAWWTHRPPRRRDVDPRAKTATHSPVLVNEAPLVAVGGAGPDGLEHPGRRRVARVGRIVAGRDREVTPAAIQRQTARSSAGAAEPPRLMSATAGQPFWATCSVTQSSPRITLESEPLPFCSTRPDAASPPWQSRTRCRRSCRRRVCRDRRRLRTPWGTHRSPRPGAPRTPGARC